MLLPIHMKSPIGFRLIYLRLILAHTKRQGQGHSQFACEKLEKKLSHVAIRLMSASFLV